MNDPRIDYLNIIHAQQTANRQIVEGINIVLRGGAEGMREIANADPQAIIAALEALGRVIKIQEEQITELVESWFKSIDSLEEISKL